MVFALLSHVALANNADYLFIQEAAQGELIKNPKSDGYQLVLTNVPNFVSYFSDRPKRNAGTVPLAKFLKLWGENKDSSNSFSQDPPNVAITLQPGTKREQNIFAVLSNPSYKEGKLTYQAKILGQKVQLPNGQFNHLNLFFDDIHWNPGGF